MRNSGGGHKGQLVHLIDGLLWYCLRAFQGFKLSSGPWLSPVVDIVCLITGQGGHRAFPHLFLNCPQPSSNFRIGRISFWSLPLFSFVHQLGEPRRQGCVGCYGQWLVHYPGLCGMCLLHSLPEQLRGSCDRPHACCQRQQLICNVTGNLLQWTLPSPPPIPHFQIFISQPFRDH